MEFGFDMEKRKILIFGCGTGGLRAYEALPSNQDVLAFLDNDDKKQGSQFCRHTVLAPTSIADLEYDTIVVASQYADSICEQLIELNVPESKIELLPQQILFNIRDARSPIRQLGIMLYLPVAALLLYIASSYSIFKAKGVR